MSTLLAPLLHAIAQALLVPVLGMLLLALVFLAYQAGTFATEWWSTWRFLRVPGAESALARRLGRLSADALAAADPVLGAERLLAAEELRLGQAVEQTDLLVRLGPALGLAGTLIPLGPGLAALGRGEVRLLAESLTVAFDTTILGLLVGAGAFVLSTVRRRWYEAYLQRATVELDDRIHAARGAGAAGPVALAGGGA